MVVYHNQNETKRNFKDSKNEVLPLKAGGVIQIKRPTLILHDRWWTCEHQQLVIVQIDLKLG